MSVATGAVAQRLMRFPTAVPRDPDVDRWLRDASGDLGAIARRWFAALRDCGPEVRELMHDGYPTACVADAAFAYVGLFTAHVNVGFFRGAELPDPAGLLLGTGRFMRHVKLRPGVPVDEAAIAQLVRHAHEDMARRLQA